MKIFDEERRKAIQDKLCPGEYLSRLMYGLVEKKRDDGATDDELESISNFVFNITINFRGTYCGCDHCTDEVRAALNFAKKNGLVHRMVTSGKVEEMCSGECSHELYQ